MSEVDLVNFKITLNTEGQLHAVIAVTDPTGLERTFEEWRKDYEHTHTIVALVRESERLLLLLTKQLEANLQA